MADQGEARVSQGGEGRLRRVSPEEGLRLKLEALREGRADIATQRGWDLACEHRPSLSLSQIDWIHSLVAHCEQRWGGINDPHDVGGTLSALRAELTREDGQDG